MGYISSSLVNSEKFNKKQQKTKKLIINNKKACLSLFLLVLEALLPIGG
jgi:hypothetical protein